MTSSPFRTHNLYSLPGDISKACAVRTGAVTTALDVMDFLVGFPSSFMKLQHACRKIYNRLPDRRKAHRMAEK
jgi:hypothetical protein